MKRYVFLYIFLFFIFLKADDSLELIAVFTFKNEGVTPDTSLIIVDSLRKEIEKYLHFEVLDNKAMKKILQYNGFQDDYICNEIVCALVMGEFLSVEKIVQGTISKTDNTYQLKYNFVDLKKEKNIISGTETYTGSLNDLLEVSIPKIAKLIIKKSIGKTTIARKKKEKEKEKKSIEQKDIVKKEEKKKKKKKKKKNRGGIVTAILSGVSVAVAVPVLILYIDSKKAISLKIIW